MTDITLVLLDDLPETCADIAENLIEFTLLSMKTGGSYPVIVTQDIDVTLRDLSHKHMSWNDRHKGSHSNWAVVVAAGSYVRSNLTAKNAVEIAQQAGVPLMAHILDYGGYFHMHPQWFALDLRVYKQLGCPSLKEKSERMEFTTRRTQRSIENVHDDYTPLWIAAESDRQRIYRCDYTYFGAALMAALIGQGHRVINVPDQVRKFKSYSYPHKNHEQLRDWIQNQDLKPPQNLGLNAFYQDVKMVLNNVKHNFYFANTEALAERKQELDISYDCFVGVSSGLKPAMIAGSDKFSDDTKVLLIDISQMALDYQQYMIRHWDGEKDSFITCCEKYLHTTGFKNLAFDLGPEWRNPVARREILTRHFEDFLSAMPFDYVEVRRRWHRFRNLDHEFMHIDLLSPDSVQKISARITPKTGTYVWVSNVFYMSHLVWHHTKDRRADRITTFEHELKTSIPGPIALENCNLLEKLSD